MLLKATTSAYKNGAQTAIVYSSEAKIFDSPGLLPDSQKTIFWEESRAISALKTKIADHDK
jgi:hypothetical protein